MDFGEKTKEVAEWEPVLEGTYRYTEGTQVFSEENFTVEYLSTGQMHRYRSEILSRVETGEFFKMNVRLEVNKFFQPLSASVERALGDRFSRETYTIDNHEQTLKCVFEDENGLHTDEHPFGNKHHLVLPCFLTSALFTLSKKIDATGRTPVIFVTSPNDWTYKHGPEDKLLYVGIMAHKSDELTNGGVVLPSTKYELFEEDGLDGGTPPVAQLWVSKLYGVPYQLEEKTGTKIAVKRLKKLKHIQEKF